MEYNDDRFEWNLKKFNDNLDKHEFNFQDARLIWDRPDQLVIVQDQRIKSEVRYIAYGLLPNSRLVIVVHTVRGDKIRIISARKANKRERKLYEKLFRKNDDNL